MFPYLLSLGQNFGPNTPTLTPGQFFFQNRMVFSLGHRESFHPKNKFDRFSIFFRFLANGHTRTRMQSNRPQPSGAGSNKRSDDVIQVVRVIRSVLGLCWTRICTMAAELCTMVHLQNDLFVWTSCFILIFVKNVSSTNSGVFFLLFLLLLLLFFLSMQRKKSNEMNLSTCTSNVALVRNTEIAPPRWPLSH